MIFRNFPSRIDENSTRFLTNNENFYILLGKATENLSSIDEFRVNKSMRSLLSACEIKLHDKLARVLRQFNSMTIVNIG